MLGALHSSRQAQMDDYIARKQKNPILTAARSTTQQAEECAIARCKGAGCGKGGAGKAGGSR